jgi:hypothetical protein
MCSCQMYILDEAKATLTERTSKVKSKDIVMHLPNLRNNKKLPRLHMIRYIGA